MFDTRTTVRLVLTFLLLVGAATGCGRRKGGGYLRLGPVPSAQAPTR